MNTPRHLFASDFDGTLALTSIPSPNGHTVESATQAALYQLFGDSGTLAFGILNGLQSREPGELIRLIVNAAEQYNFSLPGSENGAEYLTEQFVYRKLEIITPEISREWPVLFPGCESFIRRLPNLGMELAVVSSGHDRFIRRVFEVNDLPQPEILVTSDTLRRNGVPEKFKPDPYSIELASQQFQERHGCLPTSTMYIGDSREKDGGMAMNAGVPFGYFQDKSEVDIRLDIASGNMHFGDFHALTRYFLINEASFRTGDGFNELFQARPIAEGNPRGKERL